ncbi:MAG: hypothetical protein AAGC43_00715 [Bacteroidota bacterium]
MKPQISLTKLYSLFIICLLSFTSCTQENEIFDEAIQESIENEIAEEENPENEDNPVTDNTVSSELKAFPSAEGAGANVRIGNNYSVLHVTSLSSDNEGVYDAQNKTGEGTLEWCINQKFPRIIVFDVSGTISYPNGYTYYNDSGRDYCYIAGQTAPRGGITIEHNWYELNIDHLIMRYLRFVHVGINEGINSVSFKMTNKNSIADHISSRYSFNSVAAKVDYENVTMQRSIFGECKTGMIAGTVGSPAARVEQAGSTSVLNNLWVHISHRFPNVTGNAELDVINNVVYNYKFRHNVYENDSRTNMINNYFKAGPTSFFQDGASHYIADHSTSTQYSTPKIFFEGNICTDSYRPFGKEDDAWPIVFRLWTDKNVVPDEATYRSNINFNYQGVAPRIRDADIAYEEVIADVGANKYLNADGTYGYYMDSVDESYIKDVINGTCENCTGEYNEYVDKGNTSKLIYPVLPKNTRPADFDTDRDGMPNAWEIANGFDPNFNDSTLDADGDGYTNLEEYLNLVDM